MAAKATVPALLAAVVVATLAVAESAMVMWRRSDPASRAWTRLIATLPDDRLIEPQFTGVPFARWAPTRGANVAVSDQAAVERLLAAALLEKEAEHSPSPLAYRRAAVARLVMSNAEGAVSLLERAVRATPADLSLRSDLAGAYVVRAESSKARLDLVRALDAARRVTLTDSSVMPAWFNEALAFQHLGLAEDARAAWQRAAATKDSSWASEAASRSSVVPSASIRAVVFRHLEALEQSGDTHALAQAAKSDPDLVGEFLERRLLRTWAEAVSGGHITRARRSVEAGRKVAAVIRAETGDAAYGTC
jgi:tetratricopeptide (TPR) repeat protein